MYFATFLPLALLPLAFATDYNVNVGVDKDGKPKLVYTPDNITAKKGDNIVFLFYSDNHSVGQSTFDKPCVYEDKGIFSGFPGANKTFTVAVNNTDPIWLFCTEGGHCPQGQALVINAPKDKTLAQYISAARSTNVSDDHKEDPVVGGVVADVASNGSSSSASGGSTAKATATTTSGAADATGGSTATAASQAPSPTVSGAAGNSAGNKFSAGAGLGAVGLLAFLAGGMI